MPPGLGFRLKSPFCSHLTEICLLPTFSEMIAVTLGGDFKSHSHWYLPFCFVLSLWARYTWLEGVRGPLAIEILWPFLLTSKNPQSESTGSVQFFQLRVRWAFCLRYNRSQMLGSCSMIFPSWKSIKKRFFTPLHPTTGHCKWQLPPNTAPPHNIINFLPALHLLHSSRHAKSHTA